MRRRPPSGGSGGGSNGSGGNGSGSGSTDSGGNNREGTAKNGAKPARAGRQPRPAVPDGELWDIVARTVAPLDRAKPRVAAVDLPDATDRPRADVASRSAHAETPIGASASRPARKPPPAATTPARATTPASPDMPRPPPAHAPPPLAAFERRQARRIASGTIEIEARIDLHGLTQGEAYHRLGAFIRDAARRGLKTVLVITGKGRQARPEDTLASLGEPAHGVLRRSVPMWLAEAALRAFVVSHTAAAPRHGGTGALYVHLRRNPRTP